MSDESTLEPIPVAKKPPRPVRIQKHGLRFRKDERVYFERDVRVVAIDQGCFYRGVRRRPGKVFVLFAGDNLSSGMALHENQGPLGAERAAYTEAAKGKLPHVVRRREPQTIGEAMRQKSEMDDQLIAAKSEEPERTVTPPKRPRG